MLRQRIKANKLNDETVLAYCGKFNKEQIDFFRMQLTNTGRKSHGQRYTPEQKSLCLAIYKQGPKCYRFLQKVFCLPDKRTLYRHSADILFDTGIDPKLLEFIKNKVISFSESDKLCMISWDEKSLKAHLDYSHPRDLIDGFVDSGMKREPKFATHALTFQIRGISKPYKQTIAYFYTNSLNSIELTYLIRLVIEAVLDTGKKLKFSQGHSPYLRHFNISFLLSIGLKVIGSVCDQVGSNAAAVHNLIDGKNVKKKQSGEILKYKIRDQTVIHCYDPPHLIKVIRNNLMTKNLQHYITKRWTVSDSNILKENQKPLIASWTDVADAYDLDLQGTERRLKKITDEHIKPVKEKMKVSVAAQVFSQTLGEFMMDCSNIKALQRDLSGTALVLLFFNDFLDSINGSGPSKNDTLKGSVKENSTHFTFYEYALLMLSKMSFIDKDTREVNNRSTVLQKCMSTIRGYSEIMKMCFDANIKEVPLRYLLIFL